MKVSEANQFDAGPGMPGMDDLPEQTTPPAAPSKFPTGILVLVIAVLVVGAIVYRGIYTRQRDSSTLLRETHEMAVPSILVIQPKRGSNAQEIILPANMQAFTDAPIYARTTGYLKRWLVDIGAHVKSGQLLAEIEDLAIEIRVAN